MTTPNRLRQRLCGIVFLSLLSTGVLAQPADLAGRWTGQIDVPGQPLVVTVILSAKGDGWTGTIDIPAQNLRGYALADVRVEGAAVTFRMPGIPGAPTFDGTVAPDGTALSGTFTQSGASFPFSLTPAEATRAAATAALDGLDAYVEQVLADWSVPGLALTIVHDGEVVMTKGYGCRDLEAQVPVTPQTLFAIGSASKAFTATTLGILADEGLLDWDAKVTDYLPAFRLQDPFATAEMTPADLLTHRSGLPRHDLLWYGSPFSRAELFQRLRYLEPSASFRARFQYQNLMYMTAGYLAGRLTSGRWEDVVQSRIFEPLGMARSNFAVEVMQRDANHALPYGGDRSSSTRIDFRNIDAVGPAGSINSSVEEMAAWVQLQIDGGRYEGAEVISSAHLQRIHAPHGVVESWPIRLDPQKMPYLMYSLGWFVEPYRGHRFLHHGGNIDGFAALVGFLPDDSIGVVVLTNKNGTRATYAVLLEVVDRLLGYDDVDWSQHLLGMMAQSEAAQASTDPEAARIEGTTPSHALAAYGGTYRHPGYGDLTISAAADSLHLQYHSFTSSLRHFHYDTFQAAADLLDGAQLVFHTNAGGVVDQVEVPVEPAVEPVVFERTVSPHLADPAYLASFTGVYSLSGLETSVDLEGGSLLLTVPGQPTYTLEPFADRLFRFRDLPGYRVRFVEEEGRVVRMIFLQPNGTFVATRQE